MEQSTLLKLFFLALIIIGVALEVAGDVFFKWWAIENKTMLLVVGLLIYFTGAAFWAVSLKYGPLSKAITIFTVLNLIAVVLIGVFFFKENLTILNKIGVALGVLSVLLMEF